MTAIHVCPNYARSCQLIKRINTSCPPKVFFIWKGYINSMNLSSHLSLSFSIGIIFFRFIWAGNEQLRQYSYKKQIVIRALPTINKNTNFGTTCRCSNAGPQNGKSFVTSLNLMEIQLKFQRNTYKNPIINRDYTQMCPTLSPWSQIRTVSLQKALLMNVSQQQPIVSVVEGVEAGTNKR